MLIAALALLPIAGCGDEPEPTPPQVTTTCDVAADDSPAGKVALEGIAQPIERIDFGFVLEGKDDCAVFVAVTPRQEADLEDGDDVTVTGLVRGLEPTEADRIDFALDAGPGPKRRPGADVGEGDPFVDAYSVTEGLPLAETR